MNLKEEKSIVAYFSREGNNYVSRRIENLSVGNTEVAAKWSRKRYLKLA